MKTKILHFIFTLFLFLIFGQAASADGGLFIYDKSMLFLGSQNMESQVGFINYENGTENMILSIDPENLQGDKALWIFPIPTKPNDVEIDIVKTIPRFYRARDIERETEEKISDIFPLMRLSQIYTIPEFFLLASSGTSRGLSLDEGLYIHEHIEKMGLVTELVTAETENAILDYLKEKEKDASFSPEFKNILKDYIGGNYSFVISWIPDVEKFKQERALEKEGSSYKQDIIDNIGVSIRFSTEKIYFPLKPTSIYKNSKIPIYIYIIGYVEPEVYSEIKQDTQVNYFYKENYKVPDELISFFNGKTEINNLKYTRIFIYTSSNNFKKDLWIQDSIPPKVKIISFINRYIIVIGLFLFVIISCLCSVLAGWIVFAKKHPSKAKFCLLGLGNFFTLAGFYLLAHHLKIDQKFVKIRESINLPKINFSRMIKKSALISLIISVILIIIFFIIRMSSVSRTLYFFFHPYTLILWIVFFVFVFLIVYPFMRGGLVNKKIRNFVLLFTLFFLISTIILQAISSILL